MSGVRTWVGQEREEVEKGTREDVGGSRVIKKWEKACMDAKKIKAFSTQIGSWVTDGGSFVRSFVSSRRRHTRLVSDWSSDVCSSFPSRRRHTRLVSDWSSDVCSSDLMIRHTRLVSDWSSDVCSSD